MWILLFFFLNPSTGHVEVRQEVGTYETQEICLEKAKEYLDVFNSDGSTPDTKIEFVCVAPKVS